VTKRYFFVVMIPAWPCSICFHVQWLHSFIFIGSVSN